MRYILLIPLILLCETIMAQGSRPEALSRFGHSLYELIELQAPVDPRLEEVAAIHEVRSLKYLGDELIFEVDIRLNETGHISRKSYFDGKGTLESAVDYEYDSLGRLIFRRIHLHSDGPDGLETSDYLYDEQGRISQIKDYNAAGLFISETLVFYDSAGFPIRLRMTGEDGALVAEEIGELDRTQNLLHSEGRNASGEVYNPQKRFVEFGGALMVENSKLPTNPQGDIVGNHLGTFWYDYDRDGRWTIRNEYRFLKNERVHWIETRRVYNMRESQGFSAE
ncbi:hypothetical protein [Pontibacter sp. G13]|uniref:hypothetical protein n=1 Tax=Pontibacter sp. G13 TaxID=3074898 RepID=UPI002889E021|nr:hypothetical protein [Pontibacter sp. G13]WNJ18411.1 hypothetical protein RJD25_26450 [Pontibacter sp. G13]